MTLLAVLLPALLMPLLLGLAPASCALPQLQDPGAWPAAFWCMAVAGSAATCAGVLDWRFHRGGGRRVSRAEHRAELAALGLGAPLFGLLACASLAADPRLWLVMAALIAFDETRFHRACGCYETGLHRVLVGGNTIAFLAWLSWCCGREVLRG
jgi:hypothetical protein